MPRVLNQIFSFEEMKKKWNEDNPNEPYLRPSVPAWYDLQKWIIRVDDNDKVISTTGWSEHPEHVVVGGTKSIVDSPRGHMSDLVPYRERVMPTNKPQVATFGPFLKTGSAANWIAAMEKVGYKINNKTQEIINSIPPEIAKKVEKFAKAKGLAWGIKPANQIKKWQMVLKRR